MSASVIPGDTAEETISSTLRKLLRPLESHGLTTSTSPTFSNRTDRLDSHVWRKAPSLAIPQPIGDRQFRPSIVPPWKTVYLCVPPVRAVICSMCDLATSVGCVSVDRGYHASPATTGFGGWGASARAADADSRIKMHTQVFTIFPFLFSPIRSHSRSAWRVLRFSIRLHKHCSYMLYYSILLEWFTRFNTLGGKGRMSNSEPQQPGGGLVECPGASGRDLAPVVLCRNRQSLQS